MLFAGASTQGPVGRSHQKTWGAAQWWKFKNCRGSLNFWSRTPSKDSQYHVLSNINEALVPTNDNNKEGLVSPVYIYLPSCLLILATLQWSNEPWDQCNSQKISGTQHNMFQVSLWKWHQDKISNEARITTGCYSCPIGQPESHHRSNRELFQGVSYNCNLWTLGQLDWMIFCESRKGNSISSPMTGWF